MQVAVYLGLKAVYCLFGQQSECIVAGKMAKHLPSMVYNHEYYRLLTPMLVHKDLLHIFFNVAA